MVASGEFPVPPTTGSDSPEFPRRFGNYLLLAKLARGGMGEVYLAKHGGIAGIEKHCVVKTLRPHYTDDREYTTRFIDEARVVVQLGHRNIAQVFDVGRVGGQYYLAMEFIQGRDVRSLQDAAAESGAEISEGLALHLTCEVLEALDYAHRHQDPTTGRPLNLVHRDVSPQNVMVNFEGEVKLIDFGLAASEMKVEHTQPNVVMGKLAYMAPEQARGDPVDGRADLFAAAVMGYELASGRRYYEGLSSHEMWAISGLGTHKPARWDSLHPTLQEIFAKALHKDRDERFATGGELRDALEAYRFSRQFRERASSLREVITAVWPDAADQSRDLLSRFANVALMRQDDANRERSQSFAVAQQFEQTSTAQATSSSSSPSSSSSASSSASVLNLRRALTEDTLLDIVPSRPENIAPAAFAVADPTESTDAVVAAAGARPPRYGRYLFAIAVLLCIACAAYAYQAGMLQFDRLPFVTTTPTTPTTPTNVPDLNPPEPVADPVTLAPVDTGSVDTDPVETDPVETDPLATDPLDPLDPDPAIAEPGTTGTPDVPVVVEDKPKPVVKRSTRRSSRKRRVRKKPSVVVETVAAPTKEEVARKRANGFLVSVVRSSSCDSTMKSTAEAKLKKLRAATSEAQLVAIANIAERIARCVK